MFNNSPSLKLEAHFVSFILNHLLFSLRKESKAPRTDVSSNRPTVGVFTFAGGWQKREKYYFKGTLARCLRSSSSLV